jgi:hypothetical protein
MLVMPVVLLGVLSPDHWIPELKESQKEVMEVMEVMD